MNFCASTSAKLQSAKPWLKNCFLLPVAKIIGREMRMKPKTFHVRLLEMVMLSMGMASFYASAQSSSSGSLTLDSLSISASSGTISGWTGWSLGAVATTLNSDGEFAQNYDFESSPTLTATTASGVTYAAASATATANSLDTSSISGNAAGSITIPGGINESANVSGGYGNFASLETQFTLSQDASVSLGAVISTAQAMTTDAGGQVLENELIFNLNVDGNPVLLFDNPLTQGPSAMSETGTGPDGSTLDSSVDLTAGSHDLYIELDSEQQVLETAVPEPSTYILFLITFGAGLAWKRQAFRGLCGTGSSSET